MLRICRWAFVLCAALAGCGGRDSLPAEEYNTKVVVLPDGAKLRVDVAMHEVDLERGMKYRDSLEPDRGMLFVYGAPGNYAFWMYEVKIPLDIVWMDANKRIVQLVHGCKPCAGPKEKCPVYGGAYSSQYVLEMKAGEAQRHGLKPGMTIEF